MTVNVDRCRCVHRCRRRTIVMNDRLPRGGLCRVSLLFLDQRPQMFCREIFLCLRGKPAFRLFSAERFCCTRFCRLRFRRCAASFRGDLLARDVSARRFSGISTGAFCLCGFFRLDATRGRGSAPRFHRLAGRGLAFGRHHAKSASANFLMRLVRLPALPVWRARSRRKGCA